MPAAAAAAPSRSFELVSPVDSGGVDAQRLYAADVGTFVPRLETRVVSDDGNSTAFMAFTGLGSGDVSGKGNAFRAVRTATGWRTSYIGPPGTRSIYAPIAAFGPNFETTIASQFFGGQLDPNDPDSAPDPLDQQDRRLYRRSSEGTYQRLDIGGAMSPLPDQSAPTRTQTILQAFSPDLGRVLFATARRLEPESESELSDSAPRLYLRSEGRSVLISVDEDGHPADLGLNASTVPAGASRDLRRVYFNTGDGRVLLRHGTQTSDVFAPRGGAAGGPATLVNVSDDGLRAIAQTSARLTPDDTDDGVDLYEVQLPSDGDPAGASLTRITAGDDDSTSSTPTVVATSGDGETAYFTSGKHLSGGTGDFNLYVRDGDGVHLIAALDPSDRDALRLAEGTGAPAARLVRPTPDGQAIAFRSAAPLDGASGGVVNVFRYDNRTREIDCASCRDDGSSGPGDARTDEGSAGTFRNITDDGRKVYFETDDALSSADTNGATDVYEYVAGEAGPRLVSSGRGSASRYYGNSADGRDVMFMTRQTLSPQDRNGDEDALRIYDAREGGGFPATTPQAPCVGDGCRPPAASTPVGPAFESSAGSRPGDAPVPPGAKPKARLALRSVTAASLGRLIATGRLQVTVSGIDAPKGVRVTVRELRGGKLLRVATATRTVRSASVARVALRASKTARARWRTRRPLRLRVDVSSGASTARKTLNIPGR